MVFVPTLLLVLFRVGRRSRRELQLTWGDSAAIASLDPYTLWRRPAWRRLGPLWAVLISVGTLTAMFYAIPPEAGMLSSAAGPPHRPTTGGHEHVERGVPVPQRAARSAACPVRQGAGATADSGLLRAGAHYYGNPPALSGMLLATFLGYLLGKSMLATTGSRWAWLIHWLQDIIIFSFLVMGWSS